jgi:formylglycine-generating enzyme required for sulfatase activity/CheY-like chemotaxis protein
MKLEPREEKERAKQMVERFVRRFQPSYKLLAYYAALPLVLTPELLNFLRVQFLQGQVPWVGEVDLLLSDLCKQVGYELYAMDAGVRAYLLGEMKRELGEEQMQQVARLLISYVKYLYENNPYISVKELQVQQWGAIAYIEPETVAREIAEAFEGLVDKSELARLSRIVQELAPQLQDYPDLIAYAQDITQLLFNRNLVNQSISHRSYQVTSEMVLNLPSELVTEQETELVRVLSRILLVEDTRELIHSISEILSAEYGIQIQASDNVAEIIELAQSGVIDLILINYDLPNSYYQEMSVNGIDITRILKANSQVPFHLPIIGFSWIDNSRENFLKYGDGFYPKDIDDYQDFVNYMNMVFNRVQQKSFIKNSLDSLNLHFYEFEVATVNERGQIIQREPHQANYLAEDLGNGVTLEMVYIPGGSFIMGSPPGEVKRKNNEEPQHQVTVPGFFMGKYVVTQAQYQAIMGQNPSIFKGEKRPVEKVSWDDAVEFCNKLSQQTGHSYRLPSEAEWEYACRAGTTTPFYFGETITTDLVNYNGNYPYASAPKGEYRTKTTDVGSFPPNAFGLYDMHGNVWEWCQDTWHENYNGAPTDGSAWIDNNYNYRMLRGGSWNQSSRDCRCAIRNWSDPDYRYGNWGFRVVLVLR